MHLLPPKTVHLVLSLGGLSLGSGSGGRGDSLDRGVLVVGSDLDDTLGLGPALFWSAQNDRRWVFLA